ncbi:cellobiose ABC transporter membrane protein [Motilibacter rhizosphaerae]|uniref:Cellobiose ABC transporter membrane protein n=1 Tax=Motilibacter rhizosphaerae TaxID=598652 RepID=A0A4Q7NUS2_9ACTN|nr:carbohydrate ABC transporter permease [Motilibacter rhizosphaerae]RZS90172.1 cellobiose ABC transporter membrane protein [Motilibacter rhizosphaerae]
MSAVLEKPTTPAAAQSPRRRNRRSGAGDVQRASWPTYVVLTVVSLVSVYPLYWALVGGSRTSADISSDPPPFVPGGNLWTNLKTAWDDGHMGKALLNSLVVSGSIALGTVLFCTMAGFAFAKLRFKGNNALFGFTVATMMVPPQLGIIPLYLLMSKLHFNNHIISVILPTLVTAFGVFFMRQYVTQAVPTELLEAGWIDGASTSRIFFSIVIPIVRPAMTVLGMITFLAAWNDFFWPVVTLSSDNPTVQVALNNIGVGYFTDYSIVFAGVVAGTIPVIVVFALLGRQIVGGIMQGSLKG